jgi:tetratricopeptide (TPR) repeat protein
MQRGAYQDALRSFTRGQERLEGMPIRGSLAADIEASLRQARRAQAAEDLHALAERLRFLAGSDTVPAGEVGAQDARCRTAWETRALLADREGAPLDGAAERQIREDLLDLAVLWADLKDGQAQPLLREANELLGDGPAHRASWEHVARARSLLRSGSLAQAAEELDRAVELRPHDFWANFYRGVCAYRRKAYPEALHSFGVAVALAPASAECSYNRALAHAALGQNARALGDYDRALELSPRFGAAALNRGVLHYQEGRTAQAQADLERALHDGADPAAAHYNLALLCLNAHDRTAALGHLEQALQHNPAHPQAGPLRALLLRPD